MKNWNELLVHQIEELFDAERQLLETLPRMAKCASDPKLKQALEGHLAETRVHAERLEQVAKLLKRKLGTTTSEGMKGLIEDGAGLLEKMGGNPEILDAAVIGAAQQVEHYEMVAYEAAVELARQLGFGEAARLLEQTFAEEIAFSKKLADLAGDDERSRSFRNGGRDNGGRINGPRRVRGE